MEGRRGLHDLPALRLWRRSALPHDGGLQPQAEAAAAGSAPKEALQALGTHLAEGWIIIESIVNQDNIQGLDAGRINDQQAELYSATSLGYEFLDSPTTGGQVKNKQQEY